MIRFTLASLVLLVGAVAASRAADNEMPKEVRAAFEKVNEFEMYSLDPSRLGAKESGAKDPDAKLFHDFKILGKTTVKGDGVRKVRDAVQKGVKESDGSVAACFNPRHGIRVVHDKKTYDLVICYECLSATVYEGDKRIGHFLTARSPEKTLTKVLKDAKVPLPKASE